MGSFIFFDKSLKSLAFNLSCNPFCWKKKTKLKWNACLLLLCLVLIPILNVLQIFFSLRRTSFVSYLASHLCSPETPMMLWWLFAPSRVLSSNFLSLGPIVLWLNKWKLVLTENKKQLQKFCLLGKPLRCSLPYCIDCKISTASLCSETKSFSSSWFSETTAL